LEKIGEVKEVQQEKNSKKNWYFAVKIPVLSVFGAMF
jgi:hypothetical protein